MNAFNLIKLFGIFFLSGVFASKKLSKDDLSWKLRDVIDGTGHRNFEKVKAIFERADSNFNNNFDELEILKESNNPEIVQYVLSKSVNMNPKERAKKIQDLLKHRLFYSRHDQLTPGQPGFAIAVTCLNEMKDGGPLEINEDMKCGFQDLLREGNLALVKEFVEAGFKLPSDLSFPIEDIENNPAETIQYLIENGFDISKEGHGIFHLMEAKKISLSDFKFYLDHGLPLDYENWRHNWLSIALKTDYFDIAEFLFKKGVKLFKRYANDGVYSGIQDKIDTLIHRLAMPVAFDEAAKLVYAGNLDDGSILSSLPKEMMIRELIMPFYETHFEKFSNDLYQ